VGWNKALHGLPQGAPNNPNSSMKNVQLTGILGKEQLHFKDNQELEKYYEEKYRRGGYEGGGCILFGVNISKLYHQARHRSALGFLKPGPNDVILDAGCGDGSLSAQIAPRCKTVHAIDIAGNSLDPAYRGVGNLHFKKMNVEALEFADGSFDRIVCVETLEHLLEPHKAIAEFHRALKPGGCLVITYPTVNQTLMQKLQRKLGVGRRLEISEHLTEWTYDDVVRNVQAGGFEYVASEGLAFDFGIFGWIKYKFRFFARLLTKLALAIRGFPRNSAFVSVVFRRK
jgi:2-polyprenyl-3-methyl-5-hydroxy-6-metoxy-1,4-benzoquinol methylase